MKRRTQLLTSVIMLLMTAKPGEAQLFEKGILSFGWPVDFGEDNRSDSALLTRDELIRCVKWGADLARVNGELDRERIEIDLAEETEEMSARDGPKGTTGDRELDKHLDELEAAQPSFKERIFNYLSHRKAFVADRVNFTLECDLRTYRIEDVRRLFGK